MNREQREQARKRRTEARREKRLRRRSRVTIECRMIGWAEWQTRAKEVVDALSLAMGAAR